MKLLVSIAIAPLVAAFSPQQTTNNQRTTVRETTLFSSVPSDVSSVSLSLDDLKADLVRACTAENKPALNDVKSMVRDLEEKAEMVGEGQSSSSSGILAGEWYVTLLYCCVRTADSLIKLSL